MKRIAKHVVRGAAAAFGPHRWHSREPRLWILTYHRILPSEDSRSRVEEPGMVCTPETFRKHLQWLAQGMTPVRLGEWVAAAAEKQPLPRKAYAITFDDGWRDNYEYAFPLLRETETPATVFLATHMIGTRRKFWPNRLLEALDAAGDRVEDAACFAWLRNLVTVSATQTATPEARSAVVQACKALDDDLLHAHLDGVEAELGVPAATAPDLLSWEEVREMSESGFVDFGSHTRYHTRLHDGLEPDALRAELEESRARIEHELARQAALFCYPNGDCSEAIRALAGRTYAACVTTSRGINTLETPLAALQRIGLHEGVARTRTDLLARLSAWL